MYNYEGSSNKQLFSFRLLGSLSERSGLVIQLTSQPGSLNFNSYKCSIKTHELNLNFM